MKQKTLTVLTVSRFNKYGFLECPQKYNKRIRTDVKKIILLLIFMLLSTYLFAQTAPDTSWTKMYIGGQYDWGWQVQQTTDGGYIIIGDTESYGAGYYDAWLIKIDCDGNIVWTKTFGGIYEDRGQSVQQTADGGYIIAGTTGSFGAGWYDIWLIKTDAQGNELWSNTYGGTGWDWGYFVQQTSDGGYIITGCKDPGNMGIWDVCLIKTDSGGNASWIKTFGGDNYDIGHCVRQTDDGGYIITGYTYSYGSGSSDAWLIKTDSNGETSWTKTFGGSSSEHGYSVQQTTDSGYIVVGYTKSFGAGDYDVWLIKTDNIGNYVWDKTFGGIDDDRGFSVQQTSDEEYIIAGFTESFGAGNYDVWLIKTLGNGDTSWTKTIGGSNLDRGRSVWQTTDEGYIVVGDTYIYEEGEYNVYLIKVDPELVTSIQNNIEPALFDLCNHPNPFNTTTAISFYLTAANREKAEIVIYNLKGQKIRTFQIPQSEMGNINSVVWDGKDKNGQKVKSGIYLYLLNTKDYTSVNKMILLR